MLSLRVRMLLLASLLFTALTGCTGHNQTPYSNPQSERDTRGGGGGGGGSSGM